MSKFYEVARGLLKGILAVLHPLRVVGSSHIPAGQSTIIICNHKSNWDPIALAVTFDRKIIYMAKKEIAGNKLVGKLICELGAFPIERGSSDIGAMRQALKLLDEGEVLGIFPQGHRMPDTEPFKMQPGACMLAMRSGAMVQPVYINGEYKLFRRTEITIGEPYLAYEKGAPRDKAGMMQVEERIMESVLALKK